MTVFVCYSYIMISCNSSYYIFIAHIIIIIKSEESTFPIVVIFLHGCLPEVVVPSYAVGFVHIYPGTAGFCFFCYCAVFWFADKIEYIMAWWTDTLHYLIIIIIMQTYRKVLNL